MGLMLTKWSLYIPQKSITGALLLDKIYCHIHDVTFLQTKRKKAEYLSVQIIMATNVQYLNSSIIYVCLKYMCEN